MKCAGMASGVVLALLGMCGQAYSADPPSFSKDIKPFLARYCVECHNAQKAKAGVNLESYQAIMKGDKKGRFLIVAGQADNSRLLHTMEGKAKPMPPRKFKLQPTAGEVARVRAWIQAGAKDDSNQRSQVVPNVPGRFGPVDLPLRSRRERET
jgi:Planctomycete cytochrome C